MSEGLSYFIKSNLIDLIIILVIFVGIYRGYKRGFFKEFFGFVGLIVSTILAVKYMSDLAILIYGALQLPHAVSTLLAFILIFLPTMFLFRWIGIKFKLLSKFSFILGNIDRLVGMAIGLIKGALLVSVSVVLLSLAGFNKTFSDAVDNSKLYKPMMRVLPLAFSVSKVFVVSKYKDFAEEIKESLRLKGEASLDSDAQQLLDDLR